MSTNNDKVMLDIASILGGDVVLASREGEAEDYIIADAFDELTVSEIKRAQRDAAETSGGSHAHYLILRSGRACDWQPDANYELEEVATPIPDFATLQQVATENAAFAVHQVAMRELEYYRANRLKEKLKAIMVHAYIGTFILVMQRYWPEEAARLIASQASSE